MSPPTLLFVVHLLSTCLMAGVIWFVQLVHYPLMHHVDREDTYFVKNVRRTGWLVIPLMMVEFLTGILLILEGLRPEWIAQQWAVFGLVMIVGIWLVTFFFQMSRHQILVQCRYNGDIIDELVAFNWARTGLWTLRVVGLVYLLVQGLSQSGGV